MLGKSWEEENGRRAIGYFQNVRALAEARFADSLGLAASSLGWEARQHLREQGFTQAIDLYLEQAAGGDASALISLRWAASRALGQSVSVLRGLAAHPRAQRVITAYIISSGWDRRTHDVDGTIKETTLRLMDKASSKATFLPAAKPSWHTFKRPVLLW